MYLYFLMKWIEKVKFDEMKWVQTSVGTFISITYGKLISDFDSVICDRYILTCDYWYIFLFLGTILVCGYRETRVP